jgi:hypothetical protein
MDSNTDRMSDGARRQATSRSLSSLDQSKTLFVTVTSQKERSTRAWIVSTYSERVFSSRFELTRRVDAHRRSGWLSTTGRCNLADGEGEFGSHEKPTR